jgi:Ca2+-binding EF-hand superfamily protein
MDRWTIRTAAALVAAVVAAGPAWAKENGKGKGGEGRGASADKVFARKDTNADGKLTLEEFKSGVPADKAQGVERRFRKIDTNGDGGVSLDELKAAHKQAQENQEKKKKKE